MTGEYEKRWWTHGRPFLGNHASIYLGDELRDSGLLVAALKVYQRAPLDCSWCGNCHSSQQGRIQGRIDRLLRDHPELQSLKKPTIEHTRQSVSISEGTLKVFGLRPHRRRVVAGQVATIAGLYGHMTLRKGFELTATVIDPAALGEYTRAFKKGSRVRLVVDRLEMVTIRSLFRSDTQSAARIPMKALTERERLEAAKACEARASEDRELDRSLELDEPKSKQVKPGRGQGAKVETDTEMLELFE